MLDSLLFKILNVIVNAILVLFWIALIKHYSKYWFKKIRDRFRPQGGNYSI
jgi:hypothetical protein